MSRRRGTLSQSQASTSGSQFSQTRLDQHVLNSEVSIEDQVNNCVRYFINNAGQNAFIRRADIQKYCGVKGQQIQQVVDKTTSILKNVYGFNVLQCDQSGSIGKAYVVSNALPYKDYSINNEEPEQRDVLKILLLLILCHIFMSNSPVPEASLYSFLKIFKIDVNAQHPLFGNVKDYIMNTWVKQRFLSVDTDPVTKKIHFVWGIRAEKEINKHEILKFVCKMTKESQPKSWNAQYQAACQQNEVNEDNRMHVDDE